MLRSSLPLIFAATVAAAGASAGPVDLGAPDVKAALDTIRPQAIRAHVRFLADDLLEGRGTGARGHAIAAAYIAAEFEALGLRPAGVNGTYFQPVKLRQSETKADGSAITITGGGKSEELKHGVDCLVGADFRKQASSVAAPAVFVGWGVTAPERKHDDYAGLDVKGKIVVLLTSAPSTFPPTARAHYSSGLIKAKNAVAHGAVGVVAIWTPEEESRYPWAALLLNAAFPSMRWVGPDGTIEGVFPELQAGALVRAKSAELLFAGAKTPLAEALAAAASSRLHGFPLAATVTIRGTSVQSDVESPNVAAILPGSDPSLAKEYVIYTAHSDHLGIGPARDGDTIYNGALDDASGVAGLIEVARAFAAMPVRPRRSLLFLAVTAEEKGLLGSDYFAHFPTVPIGDVAADVNIDGLSMLYPLADVVAIGAEDSTLGATVERVAKRLGLKVTPDPMPEEVYFIRSDQYSFVKQGVPSIFVDAGLQSSDPSIDGSAVTRNWMSTRYHSPKDDFEQPMDFEAGAVLARMQFLIGLLVANEDARPAWLPGDFFGETYHRTDHSPGPSIP